MNWPDFKRWFNRDFWRAFNKRSFPIKIPKSKKAKEEKIREVYDAVKSARYGPSIPEAEIIMNKGFGVARTIPVFCLEDYIVFYFCIKELEDVISGNRTEHTFGGWTLGGKLRRKEWDDMEGDTGFSTSRYSFDPGAWAHAFGEFNSLLFSQLATGSYSHVLQFDLSNFYDCVRLDILERWIREDAPSEKGWVIALLFYFLNQWNRRNTGLHPQGVGIPQDALADCSRLLANYYLQKYDRFAAAVCSGAGAKYFRYADDQMILLSGTKRLEELMLLITRNLDRHGLRVNQKKVDLWTVKELEAHRCRDIQGIFSKPGDNTNPKKVRLFVDAYLKISEPELAKTWNGGFPLLNRLLWSNIDLLPKKLLDRLMSRFTSRKYLLRADSEKITRVNYLNDLRKRPIDLDRRLRSLGATSVHNGFHYDCLRFAQKTKNKALEKYFEKRLQEVAELMETNSVSP